MAAQPLVMNPCERTLAYLGHLMRWRWGGDRVAKAKAKARSYRSK